MNLIEFLGIRGLIGLGVALVLGTLLGLQVHKTHKEHAAAVSWQTKYDGEHAALQQTIINYRKAAADARDADARNVVRVEQENAAINRERQSSYEARIADARARAERLRSHAQADAHSGSSPATPVSAVPPPARGPSARPEDGLSFSDRLLATEQAIQLDELIKWIYRTHSVDVNGNSPSSAPTASR